MQDDVLTEERATALVERRRWFAEYFNSTNAMVKRGRPISSWVTCPVCGYPTLSARYDYQICGLCDWEDDGQDDPDLGFSGPNGDVSLAEARANWERYRTMYRPGTHAFEMEGRRRPLREVAVAAFEAIRSIDYRDHYSLSALWRVAGMVSDAPYEVMDRSDL